MAFAAGRALVVISLAVTVIIAGWLTDQWISADSRQASVHPSYYLPAVAGGLVGAITLSQVHLHALAEASLMKEARMPQDSLYTPMLNTMGRCSTPVVAHGWGWLRVPDPSDGTWVGCDLAGGALAVANELIARGTRRGVREHVPGYVIFCPT